MPGFKNVSHSFHSQFMFDAISCVCLVVISALLFAKNRIYKYISALVLVAVLAIQIMETIARKSASSKICCGDYVKEPRWGMPLPYLQNECAYLSN